ncbi:hypothetical protein [Spiroplasma endosymbiont of Dasysyrphus albostriatus]|uniref:hypothetical protein n=1 Tax=Spiroplasma endosymbiont of Dasysyrphus albostriatus TaxID=3066299 RepID=UPI0030D3CBBE
MNHFITVLLHFFLGIENLIKIMPYAIGGVIGSVIAFKIYKARKSMLKNERIRKIYKICKNQELNNDIKNVNFDKLKPVVNNTKLTTSKSKKFTKKILVK